MAFAPALAVKKAASSAWLIGFMVAGSALGSIFAVLIAEGLCGFG